MQTNDDEMEAEYDFESMGRPIRGKHFAKYRKYLRTVELDQRLAERFPDDQSVLDALRHVADEETAPRV